MNELKYVDPKADLTFKKVFGEHSDLLASLLNALLPLPEDGNIVSIEYLPPELIDNERNVLMREGRALSRPQTDKAG